MRLLAYTKIFQRFKCKVTQHQQLLYSLYCYFQITTLVNAKEKPIKSERTWRALVRVGQAVNLAVERFVTVGEAIAEENPDIRNDMCQACKEARLAGKSSKTTSTTMYRQSQTANLRRNEWL